MNNNKQILTLKEAARLVDISEETLRRAARDSKVPGAFKVLSLWRFRRDELINNGVKK